MSLCDPHMWHSARVMMFARLAECTSASIVGSLRSRSPFLKHAASVCQHATCFPVARVVSANESCAEFSTPRSQMCPDSTLHAIPVKCRVHCHGMSGWQSVKSCMAFSCLIVNWFAQSFDNNQTLKSKKHDVRSKVDLSFKSFVQSIVIDTGAEST